LNLLVNLWKTNLGKKKFPSCMNQKQFDLPDMKNKNYMKHENPSPSLPSVIKWLVPKRVVIDQKLHIQ
jgi:hypothetical protein